MKIGFVESFAILLIVAPFVGSFLGVVVNRLPRGEGVVSGRSRCESCDARLAIRDLVPIVSWIILRGKCRQCQAAIGLANPAIEIAALGIAAWSVLALPGWLVWPGALLGWALLCLAVIDWRHMILPDEVTLPLIPAGLVIAALSSSDRLLDHLAGTVAGGSAFLLIAWAFHRSTRREGLGFGDIKLFSAAGAWVGWYGLPSVLLIGAASGLATVLLRALIVPARTIRAPLAFGPFLALGLWLTWLYGPIELAGP